MIYLSRRKFIEQSVWIAGGLTLGINGCTKGAPDVLKGVREFISQVANPDGSFRPGIDPLYKGTSDTGLSGIAAPAYATIISSTFGWSLPYQEQTTAFLLSCQKPDGAFYAPTGSMDQNSPLAKLYNTVQGVLTLRLLGKTPEYDPMPVIDYFFQNGQFKDLPLYTTSFFPLFFTVMEQKMPGYIDEIMLEYILNEQKEDGYLQNHVASTFHAAHYCRLTGRPTPKTAEMTERTLSDQKDDGSWHLMEPSWDVHACFDALFILKQLGDQNDPRIKNAHQKAADWILRCRKPDGGFTHFPEESISDMDAVYFQVGGLVEAGYLEIKENLQNEAILGWGHAMDPEKTYSCLA
ncbi:MAG: prenyltransferase/squalene oxidase repeat-containing protein [Bacteroidales bacterium]